MIGLQEFLLENFAEKVAGGDAVRFRPPRRASRAVFGGGGDRFGGEVI